ncbi:hypothetical protein E3Q15_00300 [Wallemia mellicola]|nr:hypothetical protein E3Q15_00300 [Wallemia mellicola]TIC59731.1 hypothetical protein E3Q05_00093 [Wallemia mellicola]
MLLGNNNPFSTLVKQEQQAREREQQEQRRREEEERQSISQALQNTPMESSNSSQSNTYIPPPPLPNRPKSPPQPPRPAESSTASFEQRYEEEEPPPYEEVLSDRVLEQGPRRPFTTAPQVQPQQIPQTPIHTRPNGYPSSGMQQTQSYSYNPSYSHYPNRMPVRGPPINGIISTGRPPPGAVVFQAGDPRIGGTFCYKCDGTGKRTDWLFGITENCYKCGGIGRRFH